MTMMYKDAPQSMSPLQRPPSLSALQRSAQTFVPAKPPVHLDSAHPEAPRVARRRKPILRAIVASVGLLLGSVWLAAPTAWAQGTAARATSAARTLTWEELVPKDWDPMALFRNKPTALIREGSAAEHELMREMREVWDKAPTRAELKGQRVRLPGYVVPLDMVGDKLQDFLLVPYFGACIHSPPPPANQIVHITLKRPQALRTMDVVWVTGLMDIERQDTGMGVSGYAIQADVVEPYKAPDGKR
jgi:hypothetical protein